MSTDPASTATSTAYRAALEVIGAVEPTIAGAIRSELDDQRSSLKLIASENYASLATLLTMGTWLSDKYAEGTIGHRFYAGCQNIDTVEQTAVDHAKALFNAPHAYVQPHSGIDANLVAFWAILAHRVESPALERAGAKHVNDLTESDWEELRSALGNQRALGMSLDAGGHLTHGFRPNISGKMFHQRSYGTDPDTELLDYAAVRDSAREFRPLVLIAGYSAYPRRIDFAKMREIADEVEAVLMVDMAHFAGLVAGKVFTGDFDPVPHAHVTTTTTHKSLRGPRGGMVLCQPEFADSVDRGCPMVLGGPLGHVMAAKAVSLAEARQPAFREYAQAVADNAVSLADGLMKRGARLVTGGTDNHLALIDVSTFGLTGRQAESALLDSGIVTNRNAIPRDPNGAWYTSGVRIGTPALTSRGLDGADFDRVAELIVDVLAATSPTAAASGGTSKAKYSIADGVADKTHSAAAELLSARPLYAGASTSAETERIMTADYTPMPPPQSPDPAGGSEPNWVPRSVTNAVGLMFLIAALSAFSLIFLLADRSAVKTAIRKHDSGLSDATINDRTNTAVATGVVIGIILLVLFVLLALQVRKGKNWARIVTWIFSGLAVIGAVVNMFSPNPFLAKIISAINIAAYLGVIIFLAAGSTSAYIERSRGRA